MGKATIDTDNGEGLYTVSLDYGSDYITGQVADLDLRITALNGLISTVLIDATAIENAARAATFALDDAIDVLNAATPEETAAAQSAVNTKVEESLKAQAAVGTIRRELNRYRLEKSQAERRKAALLSIPTDETKDIWCTTYTEEASGDVATIEINGEGRTGIIIAPEAPAYSQAVHGDFRHRLAMSASSAYLNTALLPGWQRHKPTYRVGVITSIDTGEDTCTVDLDEAASSAQELPINAQSTLANVPIVYLDCNSGAFEVDDRVVVQFVGQSWDEPRVIGFESNPRPCTLPIWIGANRRDLLDPGSVDYRLTAKINPTTLAIEDRWQWVTLGWPNDIARVGTNAYSLKSNGQVIDATTGAVKISPDISSSALAIGGGSLYAVSSDFTSLQRYSWDAGVFQSQITLPVETLDGGLAADSSTVALLGYDSLSGFSDNHTRLFVYNTDLTLRWSVLEGVGGETIPPQGVDVNGDWVAALWVQNDAGYTQHITLRDPADGSLVRDITMTADPLTEPVMRAVAIRGASLIVLVEWPGSTGYRRDLWKFNALTGSPAAPDATLTDIFSIYREADDQRFVDFGSMD